MQAICKSKKWQLIDGPERERESDKIADRVYPGVKLKEAPFRRSTLYSRCTARPPVDGGDGCGMTYELVLIRGDCRENRLREHKCPELLRFQFADCDVRRTGVHPKQQMHAWLVSMHGVQDDLSERERVCV